jgi:hypothetical protein
MHAMTFPAFGDAEVSVASAVRACHKSPDRVRRLRASPADLPSALGRGRAGPSSDAGGTRMQVMALLGTESGCPAGVTGSAADVSFPKAERTGA